MLGNNVCKVSQFLCMGVGWKVLHSIIHKLAKGKSTHKPQQGVPALLTSTARGELNYCYILYPQCIHGSLHVPEVLA